MKRVPGITPRFVKADLVRPDGTVLEGWEMFVGDRSYGRSNSKQALLEAWEASLQEAEHGRPFAFRPARNKPQPPARKGTRQTAGATERTTSSTAAKSGRGAKAESPKKKKGAR